MTYERQKNAPVEFKGFEVGKGMLDLVVESKVILELKAVDAIHPIFISQIVHYLAATQLKLGVILNFGNTDGLAYKRVVLSRERR